MKEPVFFWTIWQQQKHDPDSNVLCIHAEGINTRLSSAFGALPSEVLRDLTEPE